MPSSSRNRRARDKRWHLLRSAKRVGLSREIFRLILREAPKACEICGRKGKLARDHCHKRKRHRGMLCHACNTAIGLMKDDIMRLRWAARYLENFEESFDDTTDY